MNAARDHNDEPAYLRRAHFEWASVILFMSDRAIFSLSPLAHKQPVGKVQRKPGVPSQVLEGMDDPRWRKHRNGVLPADKPLQRVSICERGGSVVPQHQLEPLRSREDEQVGLINVLVWSANSIGFGPARCGHFRTGIVCEFV